MPKVWTRQRAGTEESAPRLRHPVATRPQIHQIELPLAAQRLSADVSSSPSRGGALDSVQVYLVEDEPLTLIDTGVRSEASCAALEAALEQLGYSLADIERVVLTHAHRDHMGLVQSIRERGGPLECLAHEADVSMVEGYARITRERVGEMAPLFREFGTPEPLVERLCADRVDELVLDESEGEDTSVERVLRDGDRVEGKTLSFRVQHAPGHTPGHILIEDEEAGLLLTGDLVMGGAIPHAENFYLDALPDPRDPLRRRPRFRGLAEMRRSLRSLRGRPFKVLLPGYGGTLRRPERAIRDTLLYYEVRIQRIDRGLRHLAAMGQDVTAYEIWKSLFPQDESSAEIRSHLLLLIGALDCLEEDGALVTERRPDGVLTHHHR